MGGNSRVTPALAPCPSGSHLRLPVGRSGWLPHVPGYLPSTQGWCLAGPAGCGRGSTGVHPAAPAASERRQVGSCARLPQGAQGSGVPGPLSRADGTSTLGDPDTFTPMMAVRDR